MIPLGTTFRAFSAASLIGGVPALAHTSDQQIGNAAREELAWTMSAGALSDYRDRAVSYSDRKPALQTSVAVEHSNGLHGYADATTVSFFSDRDVELAVGAGWATTLAATIELDVSATYVGYARSTYSDYVEASLVARLPAGSLTPLLGADFAPAQTPIRGGGERMSSNLYLHGGAEWTLKGTPLVLTAELGRERGSFVPGGGTKWDWQVGASATFRGLDVGLSYVDADSSGFDRVSRRLTRGGVVATARRSF